MKRILICCAFLSTICFNIKAQRLVTGKVTDSDFKPLEGASVQLSDTPTGVITDLEGKYELTVSENVTIRVSFVGFESQEVLVGNQSVINVVLFPLRLKEVVVVGYDTRSKESLTGSVKQLKNRQLASKNNSNITKSLFGEVAGLNVINTSGQPGNNAELRIRGVGSVNNGNKSPLYVLDGVVFEGNLNSINQSDIASISVLKDAISTTIYGAQGANGVILITTKKANQGKSQIGIEFKYGTNGRFLPEYETITSPEKYLEISYESLINYANNSNAEAEKAGNPLVYPNPAQFASSTLFSNSTINKKYNIWNADPTKLIDPKTGEFKSGIQRRYSPEKWEDELLRTPQRPEININFKGGDEKLNYFTSIGYLEDIGYLVGTKFNRLSSRLNLNYQTREWLKGGVSLNYTNTIRDAGGQSARENSFRFLYQGPPIYGPFERDNKGQKVDDPIFGGYKYDYGIGRPFQSGRNPIASAKYDIRRAKTHNLNGNIYYQADFLADFNFFTRIGYGYLQSSTNNLSNPFYGAAKNDGGRLFKGEFKKMSYNWLKKISFKKQVDKHNIGVFLAHENQFIEQNNLWTNKSNLANPFVSENNNAIKLISANSYSRIATLESYFGQLKYNFDNTYFLDFILRREGSSKFKKNKWGTFYALGGAWILSNESFMKNNWLDFLKFRASYGLNGDQRGNGSFQSYFTGFDLYSIRNLNNQISLVSSIYGNEELTWEKANMFQVGVDLDVFDRLEMTFDYYIKTTKDLIFNRRVGPSSGFLSQTVNDGLLRNSGFEFDITAHLIKKKDFTFDLSLVGDVSQNKILKMPIDPQTGKEKLIDFVYDRAKIKGKSVFDYYVPEFAGVDSKTGKSQFTLHYVDANNDNKLNEGEKKIRSLFEFKSENPALVSQIKTTTTSNYLESTIKFHDDKPALPPLRGGVRLNLQYKGFDLSAQFTYQAGGYGYDVVYASLMVNAPGGYLSWHKDIEKSWTKPSDKTDIPRLSAGYDRNTTSPSTRFMVKSDYLALNNLSLGYSFNENILSKTGLNRLYIWVSGDNLWLKSVRNGYIPYASEVGGSGYLAFVPGSTITTGIKVEF